MFIYSHCAKFYCNCILKGLCITCLVETWAELSSTYIILNVIGQVIKQLLVVLSVYIFTTEDIVRSMYIGDTRCHVLAVPPIFVFIGDFLRTETEPTLQLYFGFWLLYMQLLIGSG